VSRYNFGRSREFIPGYKVGGGHWRSVAVQTISKPKISQGAVILLRAAARVRVQRLVGVVLGAGSAKTMTNK